MRKEALEKIEKTLILELTIPENWRLWRKRRVLQISPVDSTCYKLKTSFHFRIPSSVLEKTFKSAGAGLIFDENQEQEQLPIKLPLDLFAKRVLLDFSIWNSQNHRITVESRYEATLLTLDAILKPQLFSILNKDKQLFEQVILLENIFRSILIQQPNRKPPSDKNYSSYEKIISHWNDSLDAFPKHKSLLIEKKSEIDNLLVHIEKLIKYSPKNSFYDIPLNPLVLAVDYFKLAQKEEEKINIIIQNFIDDCWKYINFLKCVREKDIELFKEIYAILNIHSYFYYLFIDYKIIANENFLIKTEEIIPIEIYPTKKEYLRSKLSKRFSQGYPISLGRDASTHIEIECPVPTELFIKHCFLEIGDKRMPINKFFKYSSGESKGIQHYYTSKTLEELSAIAESSDTKGNIVLWIRYSVNTFLKCTYILGATIAGLPIFYYIFTGHRLKMGSAILLTLLIALILTMRSKESIVETYLKSYKMIILVLFVAGICIQNFSILEEMWYGSFIDRIYGLYSGFIGMVK